MGCGSRKFLLLGFVLVFFMLFAGGFASAYVCWDYDDDETACDAKSDCRYHSETWGGWCEELNCWSLSSTECTNTTLTTEIGKNCQWKNSNDYGWCMQKNCWSFKGTNQTYCENSSDHGLNCEWRNQCNGWNPDTNCWDMATENTCNNISGCVWGECADKGCWNYWDNSTIDLNGYICGNATGSRGLTCQWNSDSNYCSEPSCWDYGGSDSNETHCEDWAARGVNCTWINNYYVKDSCEEASCWHFDYTNETWCTNYSRSGLNCSWSSSSSTCMMDGCWNYWEQGTCQGDSACVWETSSGSGWCEEIQCWSFDSWSSGNETFCVNSTLNGGLTCQWTNDSIADDGTGWCNPVMTESCANFTSERECMDSYWCWWEYTDWMNASLGGECKDPMWTEMDMTAADDIFSEWNPGCYIFDLNATECNYTVGCNYTNGQCADVGNEDNAVFNISVDVLEANGINCSLINNSQLCANIPALSTCCEWNGANCTSKLGKSCWENADREQQSLGVTACADVGVQTANAGEGENLCQQITGYPLYMPCQWSNATKTCDFKSDNVFGNRTQSFALIDSKKNCNAAGGKWIQEFYCEGNRSVPAGRCEQKGTDERNCNKACFACEYDFNGAAHNSSSVAKEYCYDSNLGYCEFIVDTSAPNGFGLCRAKDEFVNGVATDCRYDCGSCTYYGNPNASTYSDARADLTPPIPTTFDICNSPKCYCEYAKEFNVTCKWVVDSASTEIGGYCVSSSEKTCEDACDRCYTQDNCLDKGRSSFNASGSCEWTDSDVCAKKSGGEGVAEICWDGIDNDGDNLIDCADSGCFADSFCGFVSGDCFGWLTQATCEVAQLDSGLNCSWVTDPWGSWCDFPGADCWKKDGNETGCTLSNASCEWSNGTGNGWCEQDWSVGQDCYSLLSETDCDGGTDCTWTEDTWCAGEGNASEWCQESAGGWCDPDAFAPKNCYQYDSDTDGSDCDDAVGCYWESASNYCMEEGCWNFDGNITACNQQSDCAWEYNSWQGCEVDWSGNCWNFGADQTTCEAAGCAWRTDTWGEWCDSNVSKCWDYATTDACGEDSNCRWDEYMWNWRTDSQGSCDAACFNHDLNEAQCGVLTGCRWNDGWCMSNMTYGGGSGGIDCWQYTDNTTIDGDGYVCGNATECKWKTDGWCNPKGFQGGGCATGMGGGAQTGMECWKYDGNETRCTNSSDINITCSWMSESRPFCEPDWSSDCWKYTDNLTIDSAGYACGNFSGCYWQNTSGAEGYCANVFDQCWNSTYSDGTGDEAECNINPYCNWTTGWTGYDGGGTGWCEPSCFSATTEAGCTGSCRWMSGWCNTPGMYEMFGGMEAGAPIMIAVDAMSDSTDGNNYTDLMGVGMRDMEDSFGFGSGTLNFADAGICNNEKIGFSFGGTNNFGKGNATVKYYVYLDTDGSTSGGCALSDDLSEVGYDFFFTYTSAYNSTLGKATETFNAQKCGSSGWITADISLNSWKEKMCGEIQGPMIAVDKSALEKFPSLYDAEQDMRVYVAIAGVDNNATSPSDAAGPGWVTPGAIDFTLTGFFDMGAGGATFEKILMGGGFVKYEDCYNTVDDDDDGLVDCDDWDCEFTPHCDSSGVNVAGYVDTSMPRITGVKIEEYTDAALVFYTTNKPTNGTLTFWYNDSTCSVNNTVGGMSRTIYDSTGLTAVRDFTLWHDAHIYNDTGVNSLDYNLTNDTTYYYKLQVCDSGNKCSTSACSSLRSASSTKCGYCNFVTIISPPTGWYINYDLDVDGTYEHLQGLMCGPSAGMKTNYTNGRKVHIKMNNSDGAEMLFYNVTLTKTGLTGDTRTISTAGDLIHDDSLTDSAGTSVELVGMIAETRDKIINNLHPEVCKIKIPNDDCGELWHCDDAGANCQRRDNATTDAPTGVASGTSCLWTIPYCEFSTWANRQPEDTVTTDDGTTSSSSSGGGTSTNVPTYTINAEQFEAGYTKELAVNSRFKLTIDEETHYVKLGEVTISTATITVSSTPQEATLAVGDVRRFEVTGDSYYDIQVTLDSINSTSSKAEFTIKSTSDEVTIDSEVGERAKQEAAEKKKAGEDIQDNSSLFKKWWFWLIVVLVVVGIVYGIGKRNK